MTPIRSAYLQVAALAVDLLGDEAVAVAWAKPSVLEGFTVGGLAAHLANSLHYPVRVLTTPEPAGERLTLVAHYQRAAWLGTGRDADANVAIRSVGEKAAEVGAAEVATAAAEALTFLRARLPEAPLDRVAPPPTGSWTLSLDDVLITRMMELSVHYDDLALSVGRPTPELPPEVIEPVIDLLSRLATARHGGLAVLRALSRQERAPETISAL